MPAGSWGPRTLGAPWAAESFAASRDETTTRSQVAGLANGAANLLKLARSFAPEEVNVHGGFIGEGYGIPTSEAAGAIRLVARTEGMLLDPTHTGKAMAGFLDRWRRGLVTYRSVVFLRSGGEPAFSRGKAQGWRNAAEDHSLGDSEATEKDC